MKSSHVSARATRWGHLRRNICRNGSKRRVKLEEDVESDTSSAPWSSAHVERERFVHRRPQEHSLPQACSTEAPPHAKTGVMSGIGLLDMHRGILGCFREVEGMVRLRA